MSLLFPGAGSKVVEEGALTIVPEIEEKEYETTSHVCPVCKDDTFVEQIEQEMICINCCILIEYVIDTGPEYRYFGSEDRSPDPTRVGGPRNPLLPESSFASRIINRPGDNRMMRRIAKIHSYGVMPSRERTVWSVHEIINLRCSNAGISLAIIEETKYIYAQIASLGHIRRKAQLYAILAACTFESLKRHGSVQHHNNVAKIYAAEPLQMTKALKELNELLEKYDHEYKRKDPTYVPLKLESASTTSTTFKDYIEAALIDLRQHLLIPSTLIPRLQMESEKMGHIVNELGICRETTPPSMAATAISLACEKIGHPTPTEDVAKATGISAATLQKCLTKHTRVKSILFME
jgi:transcription initiation factor TFIIIB Brf1 subunit/transcription initiation factor TFIIB